METAISTNSIVKSFGEKKVLDGISFNVSRGEIFGLLGPSGAGKTTLIKILTGQLDRDAGTAEINGRDAHDLTAEDRKRFGIMMDNFGIYDRLNCYDNLKIFAEIYGVKSDGILNALKKVGLESAKKTFAAKLSKGMCSRLRLARAFMTDPDILFLDEPTSGLDPATADDIHKMMLVEKEKGKTIFLTTHTMSEAEKLCDNIVMINEGKINVEAVAKINDAPLVIISELSARGYSDWLKISNVGNSTANLDKYYISDNEKNLMKYQLPSVVLMPGESIIIYGSKNHNSLGDYICNFSLNENENLLLSNEVENLFCLTVPRMSTYEIYKRYDNSNVWVFCMDN